MVAYYQDVRSVVRCPLPNAACLITDPKTGATHIRLRSSDGHRRQRFSGFHEIAHTFMPGYQLQMQMRCDPPTQKHANDSLETQCDVCGSELPLPRRLVSADLADADFGLSTLTAIADIYDASLQATGHRIVDLWPEDAMFLVAGVQNKPTERADGNAPAKLRVSYAWTRGSWPSVRRFKSIDQGDPLDRARHGEFVDESTTLTGITSRDVEKVHVSARYCPYVARDGKPRPRVLALYRRVGMWC
ncbi:MAG TPA: hypothetical protein VK701_09080 [Solirubrobacteraceae bacterium]|nr:hypothetical protein [Solirubrobacteraceae bacterium]